jgi:hypothetical protein
LGGSTGDQEVRRDRRRNRRSRDQEIRRYEFRRQNIGSGRYTKGPGMKKREGEQRAGARVGAIPGARRSAGSALPLLEKCAAGVPGRGGADSPDTFE